jgi:hypothetical protein
LVHRCVQVVESLCFHLVAAEGLLESDDLVCSPPRLPRLAARLQMMISTTARTCEMKTDSHLPRWSCFWREVRVLPMRNPSETPGECAELPHLGRCVTTQLACSPGLFPFIKREFTAGM